MPGVATIIDTHLDGKFGVHDNTIFSAFIDKEDYKYERKANKQSAAPGNPSFQGRSDNLRSEATRLLHEALDPKRKVLFQSGDAGRDQGVVEQGDLRSDRAPDVGRLPTRADGRVSLIHFSKREGLAGLDPKIKEKFMTVYRLLITVSVVATLGACATVQETYSPDGRKAYTLNCSGAGRGWDKCYAAAGELCKDAGYDIIDRSSEDASFAAIGGNINRNSGSMGGSSVKTNERSMVIACKRK
ncbi:MAG: hypothetical protein JZU50_03755 [Desulfobulbaceae bacterium]|nr:hypothetical protein [Desulfobulbaceae bacterium]